MKLSIGTLVVILGLGATGFAQESVQSYKKILLNTEPSVSTDKYSIPTFQDIKVDGFKDNYKVSPVRDYSTVVKKIMSSPFIKKIDKPVEVSNPKTEIADLTQEKDLTDLALALTEANKFEAAKMHAYDEHDLKMLSSLLIHEDAEKSYKQNCHIVSGFLAELSQVKKHKLEANYYLGACALKMGWHSEGVNRLFPVVQSEHEKFTPLALTELAKHLTSEYFPKFGNILLGLKNKSLLPAEGADRLNYVTALGLNQRRKYKESSDHLKRVSTNSKDIMNIEYLDSINDFSLKKIKSAKTKMEALEKKIGQKGYTNENTKSLIYLNLARMFMQDNDHASAFKRYQKIDKDNSLWVEALEEQGWSQLMVGDTMGAIGNMYSLHSPYFKAVFKPESYAIRTIGYINICQYGDAYSTLTELETDYRPWSSKIESYLGEKRTPEQYYETAFNYLTDKSTNNTDGLPYQVIRESARTKGFLNSQNAVNARLDQIEKYNGIDEEIIKDKNKLVYYIQNINNDYQKLAQKIKTSKKDVVLSPKLEKLKADYKDIRNKLVSSKFKLATYNTARSSFNTLSDSSEARINGEIASLRKYAGKLFANNLSSANKSVKSVLSNNEFLRYEVFSGSGENIRYQVAGGEVGNVQRIPASIKPKKKLDWSFKGEFWQDEIGNYRSTLRDNCPKR